MCVRAANQTVFGVRVRGFGSRVSSPPANGSPSRTGQPCARSPRPCPGSGVWAALPSLPECTRTLGRAREKPSAVPGDSVKFRVLDLGFSFNHLVRNWSRGRSQGPKVQILGRRSRGKQSSCLNGINAAHASSPPLGFGFRVEREGLGFKVSE